MAGVLVGFRVRVGFGGEVGVRVVGSDGAAAEDDGMVEGIACVSDVRANDRLVGVYVIKARAAGVDDLNDPP